MGLVNWSRRPADGVNARSPQVNVLRGLLARATTPLLPDDYLHLVNPLWSARELRGKVVDVVKETDDAATVVIEPGWGFTASYEAGQYLGIGVQVEGRWHWRSYSLTSIAEAGTEQIAITVKANPDGFLSTHLVDGVRAGTIVRLAAPKGDFHLPEPIPGKLLFLTAGSGITPVIAMLRSMAAHGETADVVHVHSARVADDVIFLDELRELHRRLPGYRLHLHLTSETGRRLDVAELDAVVTDWRERPTWACGPIGMLDAAEKVWNDAGLGKQLHMERFAIARTDHGGEGGTVTFTRSGKTAEIDGATTLLEAGEREGILMPFGCRMGICQTCVLPVTAGYVRDLRSGEERREGDRIQTCVSTVSGSCTIDM